MNKKYVITLIYDLVCLADNPALRNILVFSFYRKNRDFGSAPRRFFSCFF